MGDTGDDFKALKDHMKAKRAANLSSAKPEGWTVHTDYHWSMTLNGKRLDFWPSRNKFQYDGRIMTGCIAGFIKKRSK
jgi:hypothetical protein